MCGVPDYTDYATFRPRGPVIRKMGLLRYRIKQCVQHYPELQYKRLKLGAWPPADASPLHPVGRPDAQIEPWGKQFFVFNALQAGKTLLCVTDHARRPLMYLYREDFQALVGAAHAQRLYMDNIKGELSRLESASRVRGPNAQAEDSRYEDALVHTLHASYAMQRMKTGRHSSHTIMRSTHRSKK